jgi:hypothetical protein
MSLPAVRVTEDLFGFDNVEHTDARIQILLLQELTFVCAMVSLLPCCKGKKTREKQGKVLTWVIL